MCQNVFIGIVSGVVSGFLLWVISVLWNHDASKTVRVQSVRMQQYLISINNDITWGIEDGRDDYYDNMISKIPYVLQCADISKESISVLNFCMFGRRKYINRQLEEIIKGMEILLQEAEADHPRLEKISRLKAIREKYQTSCSNILYYRAVFLEKLTRVRPIESALSDISYEEDVDEIITVSEELKKI